MYSFLFITERLTIELKIVGIIRVRQTTANTPVLIERLLVGCVPIPVAIGEVVELFDLRLRNVVVEHRKVGVVEVSKELEHTIFADRSSECRTSFERNGRRVPVDTLINKSEVRADVRVLQFARPRRPVACDSLRHVAAHGKNADVGLIHLRLVFRIQHKCGRQCLAILCRISAGAEARSLEHEWKKPSA